MFFCQRNCCQLGRGSHIHDNRLCAQPLQDYESIKLGLLVSTNLLPRLIPAAGKNFMDKIGSAHLSTQCEFALILVDELSKNDDLLFEEFFFHRQMFQLVNKNMEDVPPLSKVPRSRQY